MAIINNNNKEIDDFEYSTQCLDIKKLINTITTENKVKKQKGWFSFTMILLTHVQLSS